MTLAFQILLLVLVLLGLVTIFMSTKNWHWTQVLLVICIFLTAVGYLFLAAETVRVHHAMRAQIPRLQQQLDTIERQNEELLKGGAASLGIRELEHRLQMVTRERGRVWRGANPMTDLDEQGRLEVAIPAPSPHNLAPDTIVFAFEAGEPNAANPEAGRQYLGEFRVVAAAADGVELESVQLLDRRTGERIAQSEGPWSLYESMPADRHKIFAELSEEELRTLLPAETVEQYVRHGSPATPDDDQWHVIGFDENDQRLGPDQLDQAVKRLFNRPLRDYAYLFSELGRQRVVLLAKIEATEEDIAKLEKALESSERVTAFRENQKRLYESDLAGMIKDREALEAHLATLQRQAENARNLIDELLRLNSEYAAELARQQFERRDAIDAESPAPWTASIP